MFAFFASRAPLLRPVQLAECSGPLTKMFCGVATSQDCPVGWGTTATETVHEQSYAGAGSIWVKRTCFAPAHSDLCLCCSLFQKTY